MIRKELRKIGLDMGKDVEITENVVSSLLTYLLEYEKGGGPLKVLSSVY